MKKILLALLLSSTAMAADYTTYNPKNNTINIPFMDYYGSGFKNVIIDVGSCYTVLDYTNEPNSIATAKKTFTNKIYNFNGLEAGDIFETDQNLLWIVDDSETNSINYLEYSPVITIYQLYTDNYILKYKNNILKIKPFLYEKTVVVTLDKYLGIKNNFFMTSDGKVWKSNKILHYTTGSFIQIYDNRYLFSEGKTYLIDQIN